MDDRLKIILDQLGAAWEILDARLRDLYRARFTA
jgi:hypothetical protein